MSSVPDHPKVRIVKCVDDGPATKLLGCIRHCRAASLDGVILCDDDLNYRDDAVQRVVAWCTAHKGKACSGYTYTMNGMVVGQGADMFGIPIGALAVLEPYFAHQVRRYPQLWYHDDVLLSGLLCVQNVPLETHGYWVLKEEFDSPHGLNSLQGEHARERLNEDLADFAIECLRSAQTGVSERTAFRK